MHYALRCVATFTKFVYIGRYHIFWVVIVNLFCFFFLNGIVQAHSQNARKKNIILINEIQWCNCCALVLSFVSRYLRYSSLVRSHAHSTQRAIILCISFSLSFLVPLSFNMSIINHKRAKTTIAERAGFFIIFFSH